VWGGGLNKFTNKTKMKLKVFDYEPDTWMLITEDKKLIKDRNLFS
jgi:hypothetical protein